MSRFASARRDSGEKSERQYICVRAPAGTPSTVGESTLEPLPGVVALSRTTG